MSTIYDKSNKKKQVLAEDLPAKPNLHDTRAQELNQYINRAETALSMVDDIVLKQYLTKLENMEVISPAKSEIGKDIILYKITKMVYEKDELVTEKFTSAISAMTYVNCSIFLVADGYANHTDFYLGLRSDDSQRTLRSVAETFKASIEGQFPGAMLEDCSTIEKGKNSSDQEILLHRICKASTVSSCVGVPSFKDENETYTNATYVQGIEKLALAMQGRRYTAIILASDLTADAIAEIRNGYENLYTQLSAGATQQLAYSTNESMANAVSRSQGYSEGTSETLSKGTSTSYTQGTSVSDSTSESHTDSYSESKRSGLAKACSIIGGALATVGGIALMATGVGIPAGAALTAAGAGGVLASAGASGKTKTTGYSDSTSHSHTETTNTSETHGLNESTAHGASHTETFQETSGKTATIGGGKNFTLTLHNKHVEELQKKIDKQLERIAMFESTGLWSTSAYFFSFDNDVASAETGAAIFKSIMQGEGSGVEASAVNTWRGEANRGSSQALTLMANSICSFRHPLFKYQKSGIPISIPVENSSLISSKELSMMLSLPRKSVPGLPVVDHISLAKEVVRHNCNPLKRPFSLGSIFDQGVDHSENQVDLDTKSLTQHVFVTGSTGCGKSETVYKLIDEARHRGVKFMVIEPAKGEYKNVFGNLAVFGTNPLLTPLLRINPFRFPKGIHVLEHIDRLTEIFNVCWPMYAAMPAVLKKAMLKAYENCGWDLYSSTNRYSDKHNIFPSFDDLLSELEEAIDASAYSEEVKGNYVGSLVTRVESLTNGINGEIFSANEISDNTLFDEDIIIDLSRIGSQETKALIMGILIMRLNEYRMVSATESNTGLRHLTVLEEAHNILKRTSTEQSMEGSNVAGKSVEMITNAIAEMRTYGEGFVIVDQSPTSVDIAAIKNTNTKIIMRLPDADDRSISGKAAGLKDNQIDEIAKLPTGVAVVYQNDWVSPVLCHIQQFSGERHAFSLLSDSCKPTSVDDALTIVVNFLMKGRVRSEITLDASEIDKAISAMKLSTKTRILLNDLLSQLEKEGSHTYWKDENFPELAKLITELLSAKKDVEKSAHDAKDFKELNGRLDALILSKVADADESMKLNLKQCLMEDYALGNPTRRQIARVWEQDMRESIKG